MIYRIRHTTKFSYSQPIHESVMELRMRPRTDDQQRCLEFELRLSPDATARAYVDFLGNSVHHFDIPSMHDKLTIDAHSLVERLPPQPCSSEQPQNEWDQLDALVKGSHNWDWIHPSQVAQPTDRLRSFAEELGITRRDDPLTVLRDLNSRLFHAIKYEPGTTRV
ncbi:MAG: transglutaminase N-terminal domain-containing protein, partial [Tepidisphaeraceae bacterium]